MEYLPTGLRIIFVMHTSEEEEEYSSEEHTKERRKLNISSSERALQSTTAEGTIKCFCNKHNKINEQYLYKGGIISNNSSPEFTLSVCAILTEEFLCGNGSQRYYQRLPIIGLLARRAFPSA